MKRYRRTVASQYLVVAVIIVSIIGFGLLSTFVMSRVPFTDNFAIPWAAGRSWLLEGESPYALIAIELANNSIEESAYLAVLPEIQVLSQPLLSLIFYLPFSLIPYTISRVVWMIVLGISVGFTVFISIKLSGWKLSTLGTLGVVFIIVFWLPGAEAIITGKLSLIIIALTLAGIYLIAHGQETTAGFILAVTFGSFSSSGLVLIVLLIWSVSKKSWSVLTSFFSGLAFMIVMSWLLLPSWFTDWASIIFPLYEALDWINTPLINLASLLPGIADFLSIFLHSVFLLYATILLIMLLGKSGRLFLFNMLALLIIVYLVNIRGLMVYLLFVIPAMLMVFRFWAERWKQFGNLLSWILLFLTGIGSWLLVISNIDFTKPFDVPLLSIGLPLFVFIGLLWIRWWALRFPALPYETP